MAYNKKKQKEITIEDTYNEFFVKLNNAVKYVRYRSRNDKLFKDAYREGCRIIDEYKKICEEKGYNFLSIIKHHDNDHRAASLSYLRNDVIEHQLGEYYRRNFKDTCWFDQGKHPNDIKYFLGKPYGIGCYFEEPADIVAYKLVKDAFDKSHLDNSVFVLDCMKKLNQYIKQMHDEDFNFDGDFFDRVYQALNCHFSWEQNNDLLSFFTGSKLKNQSTAVALHFRNLLSAYSQVDAYDIDTIRKKYINNRLSNWIKVGAYRGFIIPEPEDKEKEMISTLLAKKVYGSFSQSLQSDINLLADELLCGLNGSAGYRDCDPLLNDAVQQILKKEVPKNKKEAYKLANINFANTKFGVRDFCNVIFHLNEKSSSPKMKNFDDIMTYTFYENRFMFLDYLLPDCQNATDLLDNAYYYVKDNVASVINEAPNQEMCDSSGMVNLERYKSCVNALNLLEVITDREVTDLTRINESIKNNVELGMGEK